MSDFKGFGDGKALALSVPPEFYTDLLPTIDDADELKLILCALRLLTARQGPVKYVFLDDLAEDGDVQKCFPDPMSEGSVFIQALKKTFEDNVFLSGRYEDRELVFLNTPQASAAMRAMQKNAWSPDERLALSPSEQADRPNIFTIYEKNIGPLTPILAQMLEDAEKEFPAEWLEEAVTIAVKKNVRNWQYVEAILRSWKEKGRGEKDQRNDQKDTRKYIEGDLADYIKH
jgi:DnaD/phage-associated family protein